MVWYWFDAGLLLDGLNGMVHEFRFGRCVSVEGRVRIPPSPPFLCGCVRIAFFLGMARVFTGIGSGRSDLQVPLRYWCMILDLTVGDIVRELDT